MSNDWKALKSGVWYTIASFLTSSIGIITTPIFTRFLTHAEFGLYSNYTSWLSIFSILASLNLVSTFISARFDYEKDFDSYIFSTLCLSSVSVLIWALILNLLYDKIQVYLKIDRVYLNCMMTYLLFNQAVQMFQARERYYFKYKISVLLSVLISFGTALFSVVLVVYSQNRLTGRILGSVLPTIIAGFVLYLIIAWNGHNVHLAFWSYALPICLPFIPHLLSMTVLGSVDRIMITNICGEEDNAFYSLAYTCGSLISILTGAMNTAFSPWLGEKLHGNGFKQIRDFSKPYIAVFVFAMLGAMLVTPEILLAMGGKSYLKAQYVMPPVTCGISCQFIYTLFVNVEQFKKKTVGMAIGSMSAAALNYILNAMFIPKYGFVAAAYTTLFSYMWLLGVHMFLVYRIGYSQVYDYNFILTIIAILLFVTFAVNFLYTVPILRYVAVCLYNIMAVFFYQRYGKKIRTTVKMMRTSKKER